MKKLLLFFAAAVCAAAGWAQTSSSLSATVKSQTLEVALTNPTENFVAFQMDIVLPSGVTVLNDGTAMALNDERLTKKAGTPVAGATNANFSLVYNVIDATHVRVLAYNLENRALDGTEGTLFTMTFAGTPEGDFNVEGIKFVTESALAEVELTPAVSENGSAVVPGDVDHSGEVDPLDLACMVDILLAKAEKVAEADLDGNGDVDPLDMSLLIDILLGK